MANKADHQTKIQISLNHINILKINTMINFKEHNKLRISLINKCMDKIDLIIDQILMMNIQIYKLHQKIFLKILIDPRAQVTKHILERKCLVKIFKNKIIYLNRAKLEMITLIKSNSLNLKFFHDLLKVCLKIWKNHGTETRKLTSIKFIHLQPKKQIK